MINHTWNLNARERNGLRLIDYPGKTPTEARREIAKLLVNRIPCVSGEYINPTMLSRNGSLNQFTQTEIHSVVDGCTWVNAYVDNTAISQNPPYNTGKIEKNRPVCLDTVTGRCVTGVHPSWAADEYTVIGIALDDMIEIVGQRRVPIKLSPPPGSAAEKAIVGVCNVGGGQAQQTLYAYTTGSNNSWPFRLQGEPDNNDFGLVWPAQEPQVWIMAYNLARHYVSLGTEVIMSKIKGKYYFQHYSNAMFQAVLLETLTPGGSAKASASIGSSTTDSDIMIKDTGIIPGNSLLSAGTMIMAELQIHSAVLVSAITCPEDQN